jgi:hypothetical protein
MRPALLFNPLRHHWRFCAGPLCAGQAVVWPNCFVVLSVLPGKALASDGRRSGAFVNHRAVPTETALKSLAPVSMIDGESCLHLTRLRALSLIDQPTLLGIKFEAQPFLIFMKTLLRSSIPQSFAGAAIQ